ncbi:MAG: T9SS type A sorting domain-containing protein [Bacteroidia bacterium]|nr:T9SS type A sorting domain-containing protein [Bacteroidia bacterium]
MKKMLLNLKIAVFLLGMGFSINAKADYTVVASGDWSSSATWGGTAPGNAVTGQNIVIPSGYTVNLNSDVTFSGLLNSITVNGALTSTTSNQITMNSGALAGTGTIDVNKVSFTGLSTITFAGNLMVKQLHSSANLLGFVAVGSVSDTLFLEAGNINLNTNGNLTMMSNSTVKVDNGSLNINAGVFNSGNAYNVMYVGASKTSGVELNTVTLQNLTVKLNSNSQSVTLANNTTVNGTLDLSSGKLSFNGKKLTLKGDITNGSGAVFMSNGTSDLSIEGSGSLTGSLMFDSGSSINNITINRTGSATVKLVSALSVAGQVSLIEGTLNIMSPGNLTMNSNSVIHIEKGSLTATSGGIFTGTSAYDVHYMGSSDIGTGLELSGSGLKNVTINTINNTNKVIVSSNATVTGQLNMVKGKLDLNGKVLMLNGTIQHASNAAFTGNSSSELHLNLTAVTNDTIYFDASDSASHTLGKLKMNIPSNSMIVLGSALHIANELAFTSGKLKLTNGDLMIHSAGSITGYDDTKYVVTSAEYAGSVVMNVNSGGAYVTYPIGLSSNYSPVHIQQAAAGATGNFKAKCEVMYTQMMKSVDRMWFLESSAATVNANVRFGWQAAAEINSFDRTNAYVSHMTGTSWDVVSAGSASVSVNNTYELSRTGLTSLSPFAVVEPNQPLAISKHTKVEGVELFPNPSKDVIYVKIPNSSEEYSFELIDITGKTIMSISNTNELNKVDVSNLKSGYYFIKINNLTENKTATKGFVKQ